MYNMDSGLWMIIEPYACKLSWKEVDISMVTLFARLKENLTNLGEKISQNYNELGDFLRKWDIENGEL